MKFLKIMFMSLVLLSVGVAFTACGNSSDANSELEGKEYTSAYICPMHCEGSGGDEAGKCPVCGMDYEANEEHMSHEGHEH